VKYSRHEILSPIPEVDGRDDVQALCDAWMERELARTMRGREQTIGGLWALEVDRLLALPMSRFEAARTSSAKVSARSWIQTGTNFYSVPVEWVGREVTVALEAERVVVLGPASGRVEHRRLYGHHEMSLELDHYLPLLKRKHRGLDRAVPVRRSWRLRIPAGGRSWAFYGAVRARWTVARPSWTSCSCAASTGSRP